MCVDEERGAADAYGRVCAYGRGGTVDHWERTADARDDNNMDTERREWTPRTTNTERARTSPRRGPLPRTRRHIRRHLSGNRAPPTRRPERVLSARPRAAASTQRWRGRVRHETAV